MDFSELINEGDRLKALPYDDPEQDLWDNDVREAVNPFGKPTADILESELFPSVIPWGDEGAQRQRVECISKTQKLLQTLQKRSVDRQAAQAKILAPDFERAQRSIREKITNNFNINAPTTFGDNSPINQITIGEFMAGLEQEIQEKVKDETEKHRLLGVVKSITTDPSFVAVTSVAASEIFKKLLGG